MCPRRPAVRGLGKHKEHKAQQRFSENLNTRPAEERRLGGGGSQQQKRVPGEGVPPGPAFRPRLGLYVTGHTSNLRRHVHTPP